MNGASSRENWRRENCHIETCHIENRHIENRHIENRHIENRHLEKYAEGNPKSAASRRPAMARALCFAGFLKAEARSLT